MSAAGAASRSPSTSSPTSSAPGASSASGGWRRRSRWPDMPVAIRWRPFQLDPTIPPEGKDRRAYMEAKVRRGRQDRADRTSTSTELGAAEGIAFAFDRIKVSPNTLDAHRLIRWAAEAGAAGRRSSRRCSAPTSSTAAISATARCWRTSPRRRAWTAREIAARLAIDEDRAEVQADIARRAADRRNRRSDLHRRQPLRAGRRAAGRGAGAGLRAGRAKRPQARPTA